MLCCHLRATHTLPGTPVQDSKHAIPLYLIPHDTTGPSPCRIHTSEIINPNTVLITTGSTVLHYHVRLAHVSRVIKQSSNEHGDDDNCSHSTVAAVPPSFTFPPAAGSILSVSSDMSFSRVSGSTTDSTHTTTIHYDHHHKPISHGQ